MINWAVRFKNKAFWISFIPAVLLLVQVIASLFGFELQLDGIGEKLLDVVNALFAVLALLAYARLSEETERLLTQGYATPQERHILNEMFLNYKAHGWNGDMDARLKKVYALRTDHAE